MVFLSSATARDEGIGRLTEIVDVTIYSAEGLPLHGKVGAGTVVTIVARWKSMSAVVSNLRFYGYRYYFAKNESILSIER